MNGHSRRKMTSERFSDPPSMVVRVAVYRNDRFIDRNHLELLAAPIKTFMGEAAGEKA
jgi:hypothetical protein